jgi:hypothetical protein
MSFEYETIKGNFALLNSIDAAWLSTKECFDVVVEAAQELGYDAEIVLTEQGEFVRIQRYRYEKNKPVYGDILFEIGVAAMQKAYKRLSVQVARQ